MYTDFDHYLEKEKYFEDDMSQGFEYWEKYCEWLDSVPAGEAAKEEGKVVINDPEDWDPNEDKYANCDCVPY
ncbi:TPA: hypothetical protein IGZ64_004096 [Escherichia coli]|nr:hypothetical protein [Escherichia coli]